MMTHESADHLATIESGRELAETAAINADADRDIEAVKEAARAVAARWNAFMAARADFAAAANHLRACIGKAEWCEGPGFPIAVGDLVIDYDSKSPGLLSCCKVTVVSEWPTTTKGTA